MNGMWIREQKMKILVNEFEIWELNTTISQVLRKTPFGWSLHRTIEYSYQPKITLEVDIFPAFSKFSSNSRVLKSHRVSQKLSLRGSDTFLCYDNFLSHYMFFF